jgi:hypothetical protein
MLALFLYVFSIFYSLKKQRTIEKAGNSPASPY